MDKAEEGVSTVARSERQQADTVVGRSVRARDHIKRLVMGKALLRDDLALLIDGVLLVSKAHGGNDNFR